MMIKFYPIETALKDGTFIILLGDSEYVTTPYSIVIGRWLESYRNCWIDIFGDVINPEPTHWAPWEVPKLV